ncbi:unnamed protein product, partial [Ectocarpus sp. 12 AP-2014]
ELHRARFYGALVKGERRQSTHSRRDGLWVAERQEQVSKNCIRDGGWGLECSLRIGDGGLHLSFPHAVHTTATRHLVQTVSRDACRLLPKKQCSLSFTNSQDKLRDERQR